MWFLQLNMWATVKEAGVELSAHHHSPADTAFKRVDQPRLMHPAVLCARTSIPAFAMQSARRLLPCSGLARWRKAVTLTAWLLQKEPDEARILADPTEGLIIG